MTSVNLDEMFGALRSPDRVDKWEENRAPESLCVLDALLAEKLKDLELVAQCQLLRFAELSKNYIWAMDSEGGIRIAVEELAMEPPAPGGYPRRKGYSHPSEDKKLGHPTLLGGGLARVAGELAFDDFDGTLRWVFNVNSGRYCKQNPPSPQQVGRVADIFRNLGLAVVVDDVV